MVVIFAGYSGQMDTLLDKVNPGLKSRVSDVVSFPDFDAADAADVAELMLETKRLGLPKRSQLEAALQPTQRRRHRVAHLPFVRRRTRATRFAPSVAPQRSPGGEERGAARGPPRRAVPRRAAPHRATPHRVLWRGLARCGAAKRGV